MGIENSWVRLRSLFDRAAPLGPAERAALLSRDTADDPELRARLEALLEAHDGAQSLSPPSTVAHDLRDSATNTFIGPYRLLEKIGEGGFGVVYAAEQQKPLHRKVAIKLLRADLGSASVLARFEAERQALALMDHPNIASVYDAGTTPQGQPYFVMEYVAGQPITAYADDRKLSIDSRMRLFIQLCEAVQHAHQKGVIHRDLKPSNVLVSTVADRPPVKVIDFGVAKALGAPLTEATLWTRAGVVLGTPEYMSPEQASGGVTAVDTRSDVYALGVILYELLVGVRPVSVPRAQGDVVELMRLVREVDALNPATKLRSLGPDASRIALLRGADLPSLTRQVRGDLGAIALKALEKDPKRRYVSAGALAEDVSRALENHPISAHPPSAAYQLRKFAARRKGLVAFAASILILSLGSAIALSGLYARQRVETARAEHISAVLQDLFTSADPKNARGEDVLVRDVLREAATRLADELAEEPEVRSPIQRTIATTYLSLGAQAEAETLAMQAVDSATLIRSSRRRGLELARARAVCADVLFERGKYDQAEPLYREALRQRRELLGERHVEVASSLDGLSKLLHRTGDYAEAAELSHLARRTREQVGQAETPRYASSLVMEGTIARTQGRTQEAETYLKDALALLRRILPDNHPRLTQCLNELAVTLRQQGKYDEAEPIYREALAINERVYGPEHPLTAQLMSNLGVLLKSMHRYEEAESLYVKSLRIRRRVLGETHPGVATLQTNLGVLYQAQGRNAEAEKLLRAALGVQLQLRGEAHADVAQARSALAGLLDEMGRFEEAELQATRALDTRRAIFPPGHPDIAASLRRLGRIELRTNRLAAAESHLREALTIFLAKHPPEDGRPAVCSTLLGDCLVRQGRFAEADSLVRPSSEAVLRSDDVENSVKRDLVKLMSTLADSLDNPVERARWTARLDSFPEATVVAS